MWFRRLLPGSQFRWRPRDSEGRPTPHDQECASAAVRGLRSNLRQSGLKVMVPTLLPSLEQHGQFKLDQAALGATAATIDRLLFEASATAIKVRRAIILIVAP